MRSIFLALFFISTINLAIAQASPDVKIEVQLEVLKTRLDAQQQELIHQQQQVDSRFQEQLNAIDKRFDSASSTMSMLLVVISIIGGLGSVFAFANLFRGHSERKAQADFSKKLMENSGDLVKNQIESVGKLRDVIGFVSESFKLQSERETGLKQFTALAADLNGHYKASYDRAKEGILSLKVSRMGWATLSLPQYRIAERARAEFHGIPDRYLKSEEKVNPLEFAEVCQRIGTSAFYSNDIEYGRELLKQAWDIFQNYERDKGSFPNEKLMPRIATAFFLGLIAKSWIGESQSTEKSLTEAKEWFGEAESLVQKNKERAQTEFQIPVTLAEVLSYIDGTRAEAKRLLGTIEDNSPTAIIPRLLSMNRDENQDRLLSRAYLIVGNIEFILGNTDTQYYQAAQKYDKNNAYATLSLAMLTKDPASRKALFNEGLNLLAPYLEKQEVTTVALAHSWAVIAARELGNEDKKNNHVKQLRSINETGVTNAGDKQPLFFNPVKKTLSRLDDLIASVSTHPQLPT